MNYFEIKPTGEAFIRTDSGTIIRKVGSGDPVYHAEFNDDESLFVITYDNGRCEIRDRKNMIIETIAEHDVKEAFFKKEGLLIVMSDGTTIIK